METTTAFPSLDIRGSLDGLIVDILIGNANANGESDSLLHDQGQCRPAPFYGLVCALA